MDRCGQCPGKYTCVAPSGPPESDYVFIGEGPGKDEDRQGIPFVGKTGRELNEHYLPLAGLRRGGVRVLNAIKCFPDRPQGRLSLDRERDRLLLESCASHHLYGELEHTHPKLIIPMGVLACHAIDPDINLELQHGIPIETAWGTVFPMYHPAGGLHEPKKMLLIRNDWVRLGKYIKGKLQAPQDTFERPDYGVVSADSILEDFLECNDYSLPLSIDTESDRFRRAFCLTYSTCPGTGRLIRAGDRDSLEIFQAIVDRQEGPILFHNWPYDQPVTVQMGLRIPHRLVVDTMIRAYHLGNLPQGLKALAYRLLGMKMEDFDDLVTPYSTPLCLSYLRAALDREWPKPDEQTVRDAGGQWKLYKPQGMGTKLKRFLTDYGKDPTAVDIYERWDRWGKLGDDRLVESVFGPFPGKCISYVPFERVLHYACRDADATLRLWPVLQRMTQQLRRRLPEHWEDAA